MPCTETFYFDPAYLPKGTQEKRRCVNLYYGSGQGAASRPVNVHIPWKINMDVHRGSHRDFLKRYVCAAQTASEELLSQTLSRGARTFFSKLFEYATDFRMLRCAYDLTAQTGAIAQGVDGRSIDDYASDRSLLVDTLKSLEIDMRNGHYRPQRLRRVIIPKPGGRGERPIDIPTIEDRIVDRALLLTLAPLLEPMWHHCNIGFRRNHGLQDGLAMAERHIRNGTCPVAQTVDIRKAFTSLPKNRLIHAVHKAMPAGTPQQLTRLVEDIIRRPLPCGTFIRDGRGIPQGSPLSPMLLNIFLNDRLDQKWDHQRWPMVRYADDLLILAVDRSEADAALRTLQNLLQPNGLNLRDEIPKPAELQHGDSAEWLGFTMMWNGAHLRFDLATAAWDRLEDGLRYAQTADSPFQDALNQVLSGWLDHAGPVYRPGSHEHAFRSAFVDRVAAMLTRVGMNANAMPKRVIHHMWATAGRRWRKRRRRVQDRLNRISSGP
jgi:retron-type reverse transcriptase